MFPFPPSVGLAVQLSLAQRVTFPSTDYLPAQIRLGVTLVAWCMQCDGTTGLRVALSPKMLKTVKHCLGALKSQAATLIGLGVYPDRRVASVGHCVFVFIGLYQDNVTQMSTETWPSLL
ncbi:hypothetical protein B0T17DRAFT_80913 [Bombardia bombarda]|uniref:Uncharacterized protein n=1 Tax=Bombardia bombarda TaxID=252184 RepID=A0AA39XLT9_9PEZI|nr:hypothetical protein B0T17DRAFT_80913 [Bombardia bombarda]